MHILLDLDLDPARLSAYLNNQIQWNIPYEVVSISKAGEGNMNVVLRVLFNNDTSIILKQSRPYVNKYPSIPAPENRIEVEYALYKELQKEPRLSSHMPLCVGYDPVNCIMALEDLGEGKDYTFLYSKNSNWSKNERTDCIHFLSVMHSINIPDHFPTNIELRKLNAIHLFDFPLIIANEFDLDKIQNGLQNLSLAYKKNQALHESMAHLKNIYLSPGNADNSLLHGDYYPGSWLRTQKGFKVIDPEFSFAGPAEFDTGVFCAHLYMARLNSIQIDKIMESYFAPKKYNRALHKKFMGMEIIRRLIGLAQLPVDLDLDEKEKLLEQANYWLLTNE